MKKAPEEKTKSELNLKVWGLVGTKGALGNFTYKDAEKRQKRIAAGDPTVTIVTHDVAERFQEKFYKNNG